MDDWVDKLTRVGPEQDAALVELGELLKVRVKRAFKSRPKADSSFVDDVVQDSLATILASIRQFDGESKFTSWATTLAVRTALRQMRRLNWQDTSLDQMLSHNPAKVESRSPSGSDPAAIALSKQMVESMYRIINYELTDKQREVLLAHLNGMPQAEIGRRMNTSRNAVYKLGFDARKRLRDGLIAAGYSAEDLEAIKAAR
ncbi:RNA polymerase sigma factor [Rhodopirellula sp. JC639]|uniref:RNA polymerase sigma factor n=1 Tax=Stieleria mannarensis TaxID=2755585 RepID=UPI0016011D64|nr:sigma-70 family RNA polymerase sigma factor [Rhodopirellula sp. JC639]